MHTPGDLKINQAIATLLEAVQEVCLAKTHSMGGKQDPLNEIDALDTCLEKFTSKMHHIIAHYRRRYNANLPIHQLPPELMSHSLAFAMLPLLVEPTVTDIGYMRRLQRLASVSSSWARLIKDTPSFWTNVSNEFSLPLVRQILSRSRSNLLDVKYIHETRAGMSANMFVSLVFDHVGRWRSVEINDGSGESTMIPILRAAQAPALETLRVVYGEYFPIRFHWVGPILCGKADRLRDVDLVRFCIPWDTGTLRGLVSLKLEDLGEKGPMAHQLIDILSASPGLTTLHLYYLYSSTTGNRTGNVTSRGAGFLELPALRTLRISRLCPLLERTILSAIRFQGRTNFNLNVDLHETTGFLQDSSISNFTSFFKTSIASSEDLVVFWNDTEINFELRTSARCLINLSIPGNWDSAPPVGLADALEETASLHSQFVIKGDSSFQGIAPLLQPKCKFTIIRLEGTSRSVTESLIRFLTIPVTTDNAQEWPVPDLEELQVSYISDANLQAIVEMVTSRCEGQGTRGVDGATTELALNACPLKRLLIRSNRQFKPHHLSELQRILGEANVSLEPAYEQEYLEEGDQEDELDENPAFGQTVFA
ncbi:hypothetical protein FRB93_008609 [Tulasnella sp. JGI-2019a]|nr:hypothetical protein FRB93_008609 [Tulasnella sp. JGI-2019a]